MRDFEPLAAHRLLKVGKAREVAPGLVEAHGVAAANRITDEHEHDGDRLRLLHEDRDNLIGARDNEVGLQRDQLSRERPCFVRVDPGPPEIDLDVTPFLQPDPLESVVKCLDAPLRLRVLFWKAQHEPYAPDALRLRLRSEGPCGRTSQECNKLPPLHVHPQADGPSLTCADLE